MKVPFVDLEAQYLALKTDVHSAIDEVLESKAFIQGKYVDRFSKEFCDVHGAAYGYGCSNGTSAITVMLRTLGIGPGDEVIIPNNTFFATVEAVVEVGATPVLVDNNESTYQIDVCRAEQMINEKTKAIIPVHLYGNPADMNAISELAKKYNLKIIEDCAQAHLAQISGKSVGSFGEGGTFSFYPGKNLGAYGDAGFIVCSNESMLQTAKMHINHGRKDKYLHEFCAGNFRMDGIQAAILSVKLKYLNDWTNKRIEHAKKYDEALKSNAFKVIEVLSGHKAVYHLYIVEVSNREEVQQKLREKEIQTGIHYPVPMSQQPALKDIAIKSHDLQFSERQAQTILSLPLFPEMSDQQINFVCDEFFKVARI